jgi:hypothetical protein
MATRDRSNTMRIPSIRQRILRRSLRLRLERMWLRIGCLQTVLAGRQAVRHSDEMRRIGILRIARHQIAANGVTDFARIDRHPVATGIKGMQLKVRLSTIVRPLDSIGAKRGVSIDTRRLLKQVDRCLRLTQGSLRIKRELGRCCRKGIRMWEERARESRKRNVIGRHRCLVLS